MKPVSKAAPPNEPHPAGFTCDEVPSVGDLGQGRDKPRNPAEAMLGTSEVGLCSPEGEQGAA